LKTSSTETADVVVVGFVGSECEVFDVEVAVFIEATVRNGLFCEIRDALSDLKKIENLKKKSYRRKSRSIISTWI
jgi:hypothetical protein